MKYTFLVIPHRLTSIPLEEFVITGEPHEILEQIVERADEIMEEDQDYLAERG